jgi:glycoside/pentoside/hexuronide:cation symporter, GPH family
MATPPAAPVPLPVKAGFGVGSLGTGIFNSVPAVLLLYFMTDTLGIAAGLAAWAMFIPKILGRRHRSRSWA